MRVLIHVDGQPVETTLEAQFSNTDFFSWSTDVPIQPGENVVHAMGITSRDDLIDSDSIEVVLGTIDGEFIRGDVDLLRGINITDPLLIAFFLFRGDQISCQDAADVNDDGMITLEDTIELLHYLFLAGEKPAAPFPLAGVDGTADELGCGVGF
jgi:hypothetical protein